ncbi:MAG: 16S rRNA (cytosine(1402)-N(4))-methyltransferase RsmH [Hominenteromicrobium sp.]
MSEFAFNHKPVLFRETIESLNIDPAGTYIDGTAGGGGHSGAILERLTTGTLLSIDRDPDAIRTVRERLARYPGSVIAMGNFSEMDRIAAEHGITAADGVLLDIGVSSYQLDSAERGFSYHTDAPLDMRMSKSGTSAADLVNTLSWQELAEIISRYGEDKSAARIAKGIVKAREEKPIETTLELADIVRGSVPAAVRRAEGHPARRTFQALRIAVNGELDALKTGLTAAFGLLKPGGRLSVITFHSLEDRIVKQQMNAWCTGCTCPKDFPVCVCGKKPQGRLIYKKGLAPGEAELAENPRARSARLRVIEKLEPQIRLT